jgi:Dna[CI] antecedent, DciA
MNKYSTPFFLKNFELRIKVENAVLKNEINYNKEKFAERINEFYKKKIVEKVLIF